MTKDEYIFETTSVREAAWTNTINWKDCFPQSAISSESPVALRDKVISSGNEAEWKSAEKIAPTFYCIKNTKDPNDELNDEFFENIGVS